MNILKLTKSRFVLLVFFACLSFLYAAPQETQERDNTDTINGATNNEILDQGSQDNNADTAGANGRSAETEDTTGRSATNGTLTNIIINRSDSAAIRSLDSLGIFIGVDGKSPCRFGGHVAGLGNWLLIFSPVLLFISLISIFLSGSLKGFNLKGALAENEYPKIVIKNSQYSHTNIATLASSNDLAAILPPTIEVSDHPSNLLPGSQEYYFDSPPITVLSPPVKTIQNPISQTVPDPHPSVSRYIAFISSLLTLVIAVCISCFFIYHYIRTNCQPDISSISTILLALGLGIMPYAINKISGAIQKSNTNE